MIPAFFQKGSVDDSETMKEFSLVFETPVRLTDIKSWHGHIPFAFYLVQSLRPRLFVELGTHKGDSYCAFCQAVDALGIDCACFAVDTWQGDDQAGHYGEEVFEELRKFHDSRFGGFSKLIRSSFEEALSRFSDGSIDILHIDGCHRYSAVKSDFESWLPKMGEAGVVLLHDSNERGKDFGVWKLWEELRQKHAGFEFYHSHGLGVLFVGQTMPAPIEPLFGRKESEHSLIRNFFETLGENIVLKERVGELSQSLEKLDAMLKNHQIMIRNKDERIEKLEKQNAVLEKKCREAIS